MKTLFIDDEIYVRTSEIDPGKVTLLFIHGLSGSSSAWLRYEEYFGNDYNTVSMDIRGHGLSFRPKSIDEYKISKFSDDIFRVIKSLDLRNVHIIAHSFGALGVIDLLGTYNDRVDIRKITFIGAVYDYEHLRARKITRLFAQIVSGILHILPFWKQKGTHLDYNKYLRTGDWNVRRIFADIKNTGIHSYFYCFKNICDYRSRGILESTQIPINIIHGNKDSVSPASCALKIAGDIKNCHTEIIDGADHILVINDFERTRDAMEMSVNE